jgi:hypothetical protein
MDWYGTKIPNALADLLPDYTGPLCVDAMVHRRPNGTLALKPVVELNVRLSMGRIAWEWMRRCQRSKHGGRFRILRRASTTPDAIDALSRDGVFLNDPATALVFLAHWRPDAAD